MPANRQIVVPKSINLQPFCINEGCARIRDWGWRTDEVLSVREADLGEARPLAVLDGGSILGAVGGDLVAEGPAGPFRAPISADPAFILPELQVTVDGRVFAPMPGWIWSLLDGRAFPTRSWPQAGGVVALSGDAAWAVAAVPGEPLVVSWELRSGRPGELVDVGRVVRSLDLSPDGRWIGIGAAPAALADRVTGKVRDLDCAAPLRFSPDGARVACASGAGLAVFDREGRRQLLVPQAKAWAWSPDGERLALTTDGALQLLDTAELGKVVAELTLPPGPVGALRFSPDGSRLLVAGARGAIVVSRATARDDRELDRAIVQGLRGLPEVPAGPVASKADADVSGRVKVGAGPARNATVSAWPCTPGPTAPPDARASWEGLFEFRRLPRGCWRIRATLADAAAESRAALQAGTNLVDLDLPVPRSFSGTVSADGRPVAGATVAAWSGTGADARLLAKTQADRRGRYQLVASGPVRVEAFSPTAWGRAEVGPPIEGEERLDLVLDHPGAPVRVRARGDFEVEGGATRHPEADGAFLLVGVGEGAKIRARKGKLTGAWLPLRGPELELPPLATGQLELRMPRMGLHDGIGVEGADCERGPDGCRVELPAGRVRVWAWREGKAGSAEVEVIAGQTTVVAAPLSDAGASLSGRVVDAESGVGLGAVRLRTWRDPVRRIGLVEAESAPDGRFSLPGLVPGARTVELAAMGAWAGLAVPADSGVVELRMPRAQATISEAEIARRAVGEPGLLAAAADTGDPDARAVLLAAWKNAGLDPAKALEELPRR